MLKVKSYGAWNKLHGTCIPCNNDMDLFEITFDDSKLKFEPNIFM